MSSRPVKFAESGSFTANSHYVTLECGPFRLIRTQRPAEASLPVGVRSSSFSLLANLFSTNYDEESANHHQRQSSPGWPRRQLRRLASHVLLFRPCSPSTAAYVRPTDPATGHLFHPLRRRVQICLTTSSEGPNLPQNLPVAFHPTVNEDSPPHPLNENEFNRSLEP